jgi:exodeoxyribonuclease V alpha subunit
MNPDEILVLREKGGFDFLDVHFALLMERLSGGDSREVFLAAALASRATRLGNVCFPLAAAAGKPLAGDGNGMSGPPLEPWVSRLRAAPVVGEPGETAPLVLDGRGRLYLYRYWSYEQDLARAILARVARREESEEDSRRLRKGIARLFPDLPGEAVDWQKVAAFAAATGGFTVLSGGPGTGKTTVVAKILVLLQEAGQGRLRIALAAPTGKGAARLQEAVQRSLEKLDLPPDLKETLPRQAATIHRLLGASRESPRFLRHEGNRLPYDVVVVDEASMAALPLLSGLVRALNPEARLLLLGDKDQLASVDAGAVLGDICDTGRVHGYPPDFRAAAGAAAGCPPESLPGEADPPAMARSVVELRKSWRFGETSGIGAVSRAVREGDGGGALALFRRGEHPDLLWREVSRPGDLRPVLAPLVLARYGGLGSCRDAGGMFRILDSFRILCALREGPFGVVSVNGLVEGILREGGAVAGGGRWYDGRPIMISVNDYRIGLYNGDTGVVRTDGPGRPAACFPLPGGAVRKVHPLRLPEHETVYATTVHKSQGSEFDEIVLILPDRPLPLMTRELLYTAVTRAKKRVVVCGTEPVFRDAAARRTERVSGLRDLLWGEP